MNWPAHPPRPPRRWHRRSDGLNDEGAPWWRPSRLLAFRFAALRSEIGERIIVGRINDTDPRSIGRGEANFGQPHAEAPVGIIDHRDFRVGLKDPPSVLRRRLIRHGAMLLERLARRAEFGIGFAQAFNRELIHARQHAHFIEEPRHPIPCGSGALGEMRRRFGPRLLGLRLVRSDAAWACRAGNDLQVSGLTWPGHWLPRFYHNGRVKILGTHG